MYLWVNKLHWNDMIKVLIHTWEKHELNVWKSFSDAVGVHNIMTRQAYVDYLSIFWNVDKHQCNDKMW